MKRCILVFAVLLFALSLVAYAQAPNTLWTRTYGFPETFEKSNQTIGTPDGGLIIAGVSGQQGYISWTYLIRIDANGDTVWTRTYWDGSSALAICASPDGDYIITGVIFTNAYHPYVMKIDSDGNEIWMHIYEGWNGVLRSCHPVGEDGYVLTGYTFSEDILLARIDSGGDTLWSHTYGGFQDERAWSARVTSDGGIIIAGWTESFGVSGSDFYIIKTDQYGDPFWTRTYGQWGNQEAREIMETSDGGYVFSGKSSLEGPFIYYFMKINSLGDSLWAFTDTVNSSRAVLHSFIRTIDGGYALIGYTASTIDIFKIISAGELSWTKTFFSDPVIHHFARSIVQAADGSYFLCGHNNLDIWVAKLAPEMVGIEDGDIAVPESFTLRQNYPNPFNAKTFISFELTRPGEIVLTVYDLLGRKVSVLAEGYYDAGSHNLIFDANELASGIYFYSLKSEDYSESKSMILLK